MSHAIQQENSALFSEALLRAKELAEHAQALLDTIQDVDQANVSRALEELRLFTEESTLQIRILTEFNTTQLTTLETHLRESLIHDHGVTQSLHSWIAKIAKVDSILRRALKTVTLSQRVYDSQATEADEAASLPREVALELKSLRRQLLFTELAMGRDLVNTVGSQLLLDPISSCNAQCIACHHNYDNEFLSTILPEVALKKALEPLIFFDSVEISSQGEPTLAKNLARIITEISRAHTLGHLLSNGALLTSSLPLDKLSSLAISFDGATEKTFQSIRPGIPYQKLLDKIRSIRETNPTLRIGFHVTVNRLNIAEISDIVGLAVTLGLQFVHLNPVNGPAHITPLLLTDPDMDLFEEQLERARDVAFSGQLTLTSTIDYDDFLTDTALDTSEDSHTKIGTLVSSQKRHNDSLVSLTNELHAIGSVRFPAPLPEWVTTIKRHEHPAHTSDYEVSTLHSKTSDLLVQLRDIPSQQIRIPYCMAPWTKNIVNATGGLHPCARIAENFGHLSKGGSMLYQLNSEKFRSLRKSLVGDAPLNEICQGCSHPDRYHSLGEYLSFLEEHGRNPSELRVPSNFRPGPEFSLKGIPPEVKERRIRWRTIQGTTTELAKESTFAELAQEHVVRRSDLCFLSADLRWYRGVWMASKQHVLTVATSSVDFDKSALSSIGRSLADGLSMQLGEVLACEIVSTSLQAVETNSISAEISFKNNTGQWLWGTGCREDGHDVLGFRFFSLDGANLGEARLFFDNECIPPGAERTIKGSLVSAGFSPSTGRFIVEVDIVRELVNWSNPKQKRFTMPIEFSFYAYPRDGS